MRVAPCVLQHALGQRPDPPVGNLEELVELHLEEELEQALQADEVVVGLGRLDQLACRNLIWKSLQELIGSGCIKDINTDNPEVSSKQLDVAITPVEDFDVAVAFENGFER